MFHSPFNFDGTSPGGVYLATSNTQPVWRSTNSSNGPLNRTGLWTLGSSGDPDNTWLGFSFCITAPETKTYWVGLAGDNNFRIAIDGVTIVNTIDGIYDGSNTAFRYWHVYPVTLSIGNHAVELFGLNNGSIAAFGCEIYNNTIEELTGATQVSDLNILFSSSGQTEATIVQDLSGQYLASGYTCPTGYTFDPCTISCFQIIPPCTPTPTPTPSATIACPLTVDATIESFTPTPTRTPAITPSSTSTISRDCGFLGDVTFNTINSTIDCPSSVEFQDCYNGSSYYTTNQLVRPEGGPLERFMIYQATVDGVRKCVSYVGVSQNIIGGSNVEFVSNLIGYSNLGDCGYCLEILAVTPTPTPSITPTRIISSTPTPTPTPTQSGVVYYYLYKKCGTPNEYICWNGVPFGPASNWSVGNTFETTFADNLYPNTCWSLYSVGTSCDSQGVPSYEITTYNGNPFTNITPVIKQSCLDCNVADETKYFDPCNFFGTRLGKLYQMNTTTLVLTEVADTGFNYGQLTFTDNKLFIASGSIKEFNITFNPFTLSYVRSLSSPQTCSGIGFISTYSRFTPNGSDFYFININNITSGGAAGPAVYKICKYTIPQGTTDVNLNCGTFDELVNLTDLGIATNVTGALVYTTTNKIILRGQDVGVVNEKFYQFNLVGSTWTLELTIPISAPPSSSYRGLMVFNNKFRFSDTTTQEVFEMLPYPPYTVTSVGVYSGGLNPGDTFFGVSQNSNCVNIHFTA